MLKSMIFYVISCPEKYGFVVCSHKHMLNFKFYKFNGFLLVLLVNLQGSIITKKQSQSKSSKLIGFGAQYVPTSTHQKNRESILVRESRFTSTKLPTEILIAGKQTADEVSQRSCITGWPTKTHIKRGVSLLPFSSVGSQM